MASLISPKPSALAPDQPAIGQQQMARQHWISRGPIDHILAQLKSVRVFPDAPDLSGPRMGEW